MKKFLVAVVLASLVAFAAPAFAGKKGPILWLQQEQTGTKKTEKTEEGTNHLLKDSSQKDNTIIIFP